MASAAATHSYTCQRTPEKGKGGRGAQTEEGTHLSSASGMFELGQGKPSGGGRAAAAMPDLMSPP
jgi:hypothetical protein